MRRRTCLLLAAGAAARAREASAAPGGTAPGDDLAAWHRFRDRFIRPDGRVVDTGNAGVTHTEGQGWGLLFAEGWDDPATFERILGWTDQVLHRPGDALHAWRYVPDNANPVPDGNNATDGDLFIAWALARAARRWRRPELAMRAAGIARSVLSLLVAEVSGQQLLLPGADGFRKADGCVVNPSYYAFAALEALAALVPDRRWAVLRNDGVRLLDRARFGRWALPPDWAWAGTDGTVRPAPGFPPRYGYDAVRVPLHLAWAGLHTPARAAVAAWWRREGMGGPGPAWVDLETGEAASYLANPGMAAVEALSADPAAFVPPAPDDGMDYYGAALALLARLAARDLSAGRSEAGRR